MNHLFQNADDFRMKKTTEFFRKWCLRWADNKLFQSNRNVYSDCKQTISYSLESSESNGLVTRILVHGNDVR